MKSERVPEPEPTNPQIQIPNIEVWEKLGVKPYFIDDQYCLIKEKRLSIHEKRGHYTYQDFINAVNAWQQSDFSHPLSSKGFRADDMFFFDTETTGLGGGTGNTIFLLGYCFLEGEEIVVRQHLLTEPGFEVPLYDSFLSSVDYTTLVTYNGKAFDWPQVKTRHTLIRDHVPKLPAFGHFDLLHASRRLWKNQLESVKLSKVEENILGISREDDVPGYLAPIIYFDFVQTKQMEGILKVMEHNEDDVLSLMILYTHISYQLLGLDKNQSSSEKLSIGHWFAHVKETDKAIELLTEAVEQNEHGLDSFRGMYELAIQYKKGQNHEKANLYFERIARDGKGKLRMDACIELAKYHEHSSNLPQALTYSKWALEEWKITKKMIGILNEKLKVEIEKRILRLENKLDKEEFADN